MDGVWGIHPLTHELVDNDETDQDHNDDEEEDEEEDEEGDEEGGEKGGDEGDEEGQEEEVEDYSGPRGQDHEDLEDLLGGVDLGQGGAALRALEQRRRGRVLLVDGQPLGEWVSEGDEDGDRE